MKTRLHINLMSSNQSYNPTLLVILDGFGIPKKPRTASAISPQTAPFLYQLMNEYPSSQLTAHGTAVGLFPNQEGNSEAGHFAIGAGRVVVQDLVRISQAIDDGTFYKNEAFEQATYHIQKYHTSAHVFGLLTNGQSAHANPSHLYAMLAYLRKKKIKHVYLHLFTDGRDSPPHSAVKHLEALKKHMQPHEKIVSIMGRFYGMDRNKLWERTKQAYEAMVLAKGYRATSAEEAISAAYGRGETDEYISPTVIGDITIQDNDAIFFINARSDRARQITKAFVQPQFKKMNPGAFRRSKRPKNIRFVAMTDFGPDLPGIFTAFPSPDIDQSLPACIPKKIKQLYISETEKYAHVTYFINGGYAQPVNGETRELIRSPKKYSYAEQPEMSAYGVTDKVVTYLQQQAYDFICINYPNVDMVGHTGNIVAAREAVGVVDACLRVLVQQVLAMNGRMIITADHGNAEVMQDKHTHEMITQHTTNQVPCIMIDRSLRSLPARKKTGTLSDVAPTVLSMMDLPIPTTMTGTPLI